MTFQEKVKQVTSYLDVWKKLLQTIFIIVPILASVAAGGTWAFKTVYHEEITKAEKVYKYMKLAEDSILPSSLRVHGMFRHDIDSLESMVGAKHNGSFAIGLRWDQGQEKVMYRGTDKVLREAHKVPGTGTWYYIKDGVSYYVYQ